MRNRREPQLSDGRYLPAGAPKLGKGMRRKQEGRVGRNEKREKRKEEIE
jgi:hypothetical protein